MGLCFVGGLTGGMVGLVPVVGWVFVVLGDQV